MGVCFRLSFFALHFNHRIAKTMSIPSTSFPNCLIWSSYLFARVPYERFYCRFYIAILFLVCVFNGSACKVEHASVVVLELEHSTTASGIKVWVGDLPKKRNIDRDLRSAFRHVPGLLEISPSVVGNEKTRDPICKGFGFLTFDTLDHAQSFISSFQDQTVSFGKVEKRISFSITKASVAEAVSSGTKSSFAVSKLRVRDGDAGTATGSSMRAELGFPRIVEQGNTVDSTQERGPTQFFQPKVEVIKKEAEAASFEADDEFPGEEESDDDFDSDDESEFEVSVEIGDVSAAYISRPQGVEDKNLSEAERRIEEFEARIRKKLASGDIESQKKSEKLMTKPRGFKSRKSLPKGNNLAAVTHGLKKKEREVMTGVLEKYGRGPSPTKP